MSSSSGPLVPCSFEPLLASPSPDAPFPHVVSNQQADSPRLVKHLTKFCPLGMWHWKVIINLSMYAISSHSHRWGFSKCSIEPQDSRFQDWQSNKAILWLRLDQSKHVMYLLSGMSLLLCSLCSIVDLPFSCVPAQEKGLWVPTSFCAALCKEEKLTSKSEQPTI
jgi:hypothetical protein